MQCLAHRTQCKKKKHEIFQQTQIILAPKYLSRSNLENAYPHLMFSFTNEKIMGI